MDMQGSRQLAVTREQAWDALNDPEILKRCITGVYQHVSPKHLKRYVGEFDYRYNYRHLTDAERANQAIKGAEGKRLTYRRTNGPEA